MESNTTDIEEKMQYTLRAAHAFKEVIEDRNKKIDNKIKFVVGGGLALHLHQQFIGPTKKKWTTRMTSDVDIDVSVKRDDIKEIFAKKPPNSYGEFQWKESNNTLSIIFKDDNKKDFKVNFDICFWDEQRLRLYFQARNGFFETKIELNAGDKGTLPVPPAHLLYLMKFQAVVSRTANFARDMWDLVFLLRHSEYFKPNSLVAGLEPYRAQYYPATGALCQEYFDRYLTTDGGTGRSVVGTHAWTMYGVLGSPKQAGVSLIPEGLRERESKDVLIVLENVIVEVYQSLGGDLPIVR